MSKTIGGYQFIRNGCLYDYCFVESIESLCDFCDKVSVVGIETGDGTIEELKKLAENHPKIILTILSEDDWQSIVGKEKLSYFQNIASGKLDTDYIYLCQADEITHESCYRAIREAVEEGGEGYLVTRFNLWQSCNLMLDVPQHRKPCSTEVIRLAKRGYYSYSDGESVAAPADDGFIKDIRIYHMGFVRKKEVHVEKITQMQRDIFLTSPDRKLDGMTDFDPTQWFGSEDLIPIPEPLPKRIQKWAETRP